MSKKAKAVVLISGGLDSLLAAKVIQDQGVYVEGINFYTGFCVEGHTHAIRKKDKNKDKRNNALWVAEQLGIKLHIIDIVEDYKQIVINPKHGYGANLNPCLDCKIFMVKQAHDWMEENDFDFIVTGEVVGQRPKSQRKETMRVVVKESGVANRLLRPLSAKNLAKTYAEEQGYVKREELYDFSGRSRKPQMALAAELGFTDYAQPAGGCCFLTDKSYSNKLADLWQHRGEKIYELDDIMLLKVGRHLRPNERFKMIISREEGENQFLYGYRKQFISMQTTDVAGPFALIDGAPNEQDLLLAGQLLGRFGQGKNQEQISIDMRLKDGVNKTIKVAPLSAEAIPKSWYLL